MTNELLRVVVVDDEQLARAELRMQLELHSDVRIVGEAASVADATSQVELIGPDLVFLDIELSDGRGFGVFERTTVRSQVIFLTAYSDHAVRAFDVGAVDYLLKPVQPRRLDQALDRARARQGLGYVAPAGHGCAGETRHRTEPRLSPGDYVHLREPNRLRTCLVEEIAFIQAADSYTDIHLVDGTVSTVRERLHAWELRLPESFFRIHRSTVVNLAHVTVLSHTPHGWTLGLRCEPTPLPVSRRLARALRHRIERLSPWT